MSSIPGYTVAKKMPTDLYIFNTIQDGETLHLEKVNFWYGGVLPRRAYLQWSANRQHYRNETMQHGVPILRFEFKDSQDVCSTEIVTGVDDITSNGAFKLTTTREEYMISVPYPYADLSLSLHIQWCVRLQSQVSTPEYKKTVERFLRGIRGPRTAEEGDTRAAAGMRNFADTQTRF